MQTLEQICVEIARMHPEANLLALDAWLHGQTHGEADGLLYARVILDGVRSYIADTRALRPAGSVAGSVLGTKPAPGGELWWMGCTQLKTRLKPRMEQSEAQPEWALYWANTAEGWWKIPSQSLAKTAA